MARWGGEVGGRGPAERIEMNRYAAFDVISTPFRLPLDVPENASSRRFTFERPRHAVLWRGEGGGSGVRERSVSLDCHWGRILSE